LISSFGSFLRGLLSRYNLTMR